MTSDHGIVRNSGDSWGGPEKMSYTIFNTIIYTRFHTSVCTHSGPAGGFHPHKLSRVAEIWFLIYTNLERDVADHHKRSEGKRIAGIISTLGRMSKILNLFVKKASRVGILCMGAMLLNIVDVRIEIF